MAAYDEAGKIKRLFILQNYFSGITNFGYVSGDELLLIREGHLFSLFFFCNVRAAAGRQFLVYLISCYSMAFGREFTI